MSTPVQRCIERRDRLLRLLQKLLDGPPVIHYVSLAKELNVSVDTLRRDLKLLEDILCTEQKYFKMVHGKVHTYFQKELAPLHEDLQLYLLLALKQMDYFSIDEEGKRLNTKVRSFFRRSIDADHEEKWINIEEFIIISKFSTPLRRDTFYRDIVAILKAIDHGVFISALKDERRRYLDPFAIYYTKHTFYLIAEEYQFIREGRERILIPKSDLRHFRLDRLTDLKVTAYSTRREKASKKESAIRYTNLMWEAEGPQTGAKDSPISKPYTLQLDILDQSVWKRIKERHWGAQQTFIEGDGDICGSLYLDNVTSWQEVKKWVLSWGSAVKIIQPVWLRNEVKNEVKKMLELYN